MIVEPEMTPCKQIVGNANVPDVPEKVAHVVPAGTLTLLIAPPAAIPVPDATDALLDAAVVVRVVTADAQLAKLKGPCTANG